MCCYQHLSVSNTNQSQQSIFLPCKHHRIDISISIVDHLFLVYCTFPVLVRKLIFLFIYSFYIYISSNYFLTWHNKINAMQYFSGFFFAISPNVFRIFFLSLSMSPFCLLTVFDHHLIPPHHRSLTTPPPPPIWHLESHIRVYVQYKCYKHWYRANITE